MAKSYVKWNERQLKEFNAKVKKLSEISKTEVPDVLNEAGRIVEQKMKKLAPVDTGNLKREIYYDVDYKNQTILWESTAINKRNKVDYAPIQEYGLSGLTPQPYFQPALRTALHEMNQELEERINDIIRR